MEDDADRASVLARLVEMLDSMGESKVTLIGDVMLDRFHHGYANNLDSTAPVPVLKIMRTEETPGAAAHIAMGLRSLGMQVSLHCCVGDDREGRTIITKLSEHAQEPRVILGTPGGGVANHDVLNGDLGAFSWDTLIRNNKAPKTAVVLDQYLTRR